MDETIKFKASYLNLSLKRLFTIGVLVSISLFVGLDIDLGFRYFLSMLFVFIGLLIVFYLNKNDPETIKFHGDKFEVTFFNKFFFKRSSCVYKRQETESRIKGKTIELFMGEKIVAIIRNSATTSNEDWIKLKSFFPSINPKGSSY